MTREDALKLVKENMKNKNLGKDVLAPQGLFCAGRQSLLERRRGGGGGGVYMSLI